MPSQRLTFIFGLVIISVAGSNGKKCPTACTKDIAGCRHSGGKILGYCVNGLACCDLTYKDVGTCGETKDGFQAINFVSPNYPKSLNSDLVCSFGFILFEDTIAVKVEFINVTMDGLGFAGNGAGCDSDMFLFKGFKTWTPPALCGNLTGYITVIGRTRGTTRMNQLKIVALMSSENYRWKIRLSQIRHPAMLRKTEAFKLPLLPRPPSGVSRLQPGINMGQNASPQATSSFRINNHGADQLIENKNDDREREKLIPSTKTKTFNPDAESIFVETGDVFENDDVDKLEIPMIVNGADTKIEQVPWQVSIRLIATETNETDSEDGTTEGPSTESSNEVFGPTIDYDNISDSVNDTVNATAVPTTETKRNCSHDEGYHFCGGTVISDRFVLTAAHCFYGNSKLQGMEPLYKVKIVLGDTDTCTNDFNNETSINSTGTSDSSSNMTEQVHEIETVIFHYGYDNVALINDVALVKLKTPIEFNPNVKIVRMAKPGEDFQGKEAIGSGWGKDNLTAKATELPHILQSSPHFLIRNQSDCNSESERLFGANQTTVVHHGKYLHAFDSVLCTSTRAEVRAKLRGNVLVGPGDSGGPLVAETDDGEKVLIGIVSYGIPSENTDDKGEYVDFFQSVAFFNKWIHLAMMV